MISDNYEAAADRVARNQTLFRAVNEEIESTHETFGIPSERVKFVCECPDLHCTDRVTLTLADYENIRRTPTRFIVRAGHVYPEFEKIVDRLDGCQVVEKLGEAGSEARQLDPLPFTAQVVRGLVDT